MYGVKRCFVEEKNNELITYKVAGDRQLQKRDGEKE